MKNQRSILTVIYLVMFLTSFIISVFISLSSTHKGETRHLTEFVSEKNSNNENSGILAFVNNESENEVEDGLDARAFFVIATFWLPLPESKSFVTTHHHPQLLHDSNLYLKVHNFRI